MQDIRVVIGDSKFDVRACGILRQEGCVLTTIESDGTKTLPGGAVKIGETSEQAVIREFKEEAGMTISVDSLLSVIENRFMYEEKPYQQIIFVYEVSATSKENKDNHDEVVVEWSSIVDITSLKPHQLNDIIKNDICSIQHFINSEM
ncbi:NUDIX hydrolase [Vagococcus sp. JNUCC 83]